VKRAVAWSARCLVDGCSWTAEGSVRDVDLAAERHTKQSHPTTQEGLAQ
jgi:hypothetical protein